MNTFSIDKSSFINDFLSPISKINEKCIINFEDNKASAIVTENTSAIFLFCESNIGFHGEKVSLNVGDVMKLQKALGCIEEDTPSFSLNQNNLQYKSKTLKFKYHLLEDGVIKTPPFNRDKLTNIPFTTEFKINKKEYSDVLKNSVFTSDSNKIYFYTKNKAVYCELNDKTIPNIDCIDMKVSESFEGSIISVPFALRLDWLRYFNGINFTEIECCAI